MSHETALSYSVDSRSTDLLAKLLRCELDQVPLTNMVVPVRRMDEFFKGTVLVVYIKHLIAFFVQ